MTDPTGSGGRKKCRRASAKAAVPVKAISASEISPLQAEDRALFDELTQAGATSAANSAGKWQAGVLAILAFVTGGVFLKGGDAASDMDSPWRYIFTAILIAALCFATIGLLLFLRLSSGFIVSTSRDKMIDKHGSVAAYVRAREERASFLTRSGVWLGVIAVILLVAAATTWLLVSVEKQPDLFTVKTTQGTEQCGQLLSAPADFLLVGSKKGGKYVPIRIQDVKEINVAASC